MHPLFHITAQQVAKLNDEQARELIARLSRAEVELAGLDAQAVLWGGNQRAADGGVDVRLDIKPARNIGGPLTRSVAIVQVKAEIFGPAKVAPEMAPKGVIRPAIEALAADAGLYLIASTRDDPADPARRDRVLAMEKVLADHGLAGRVSVDFVGARQIADWVERFPSIAIWLRDQIDTPLHGWRGYGPWAYKETDTKAEFLLGKEPRIFPPGATDGSTDIEAIESIRADLAAGKSVRLLGLSGVGKTRLAQALFDPRIATTTPALSTDSAIYTDISDGPVPIPEVMVETLGASTQRTVLVIDNCGQATHSALVQRKSRVTSPIGLLTIEYDIQDDHPEDTRCYRIEGASSETIQELLKERYPKLSRHDIDVVIDSSEGNARLAFALASTSEHTGDLSSLHDRELFRRLFEQKAGKDDELLRCAKAASLVYSFNGEDLSDESEISILCRFSGTTPEAFYRNIAELSRRGLIQSRGKMRALLPHAMSNRLAADAVEEAPLEMLEKVLMEGATPRIRASFVHRLSFLHSVPRAQQLAEKWLSPGGRFSDLTRLTSDYLQSFRRLAMVKPDQALLAIERFVGKSSAFKRGDYSIDGLSDLLCIIAYESVYFDRCVAALLALYPLQSIDRNTGKPPLRHLKSLFQLILSGTNARAAQRAEIVERLLSSSSTEEQDIGTQLLDEALKIEGFGSHAPFRFGARKRNYGWWPSSIDEQRDWHRTFLAIAEKWAMQDSELGAAIRSVIGRRAGGLVRDAELAEEFTRLAPKLIRFDGWLEAWESVNRLLKRKGLSDEIFQRASKFLELVAPDSLRARALAAISLREYVAPEDEIANDHVHAYEQSQKTAERIGRLLAANPSLLEELLPLLLKANTKGNAFNIGHGLAWELVDIPTLIAKIKHAISEAGDPAKVSLTFVRGLLAGWNQRAPEDVSLFLDEAVSDPVLGYWFPELQVQAAIGTRGAERLLESLRIGRAPAWQFRYLSLGGVLGSVPAESLERIFSVLAGKDKEGVHAAIDVLHMVVYSAKDRDAADRKIIGRLCCDLLVNYPWPEVGGAEQLDYEVEQIITFATSESDSFDDVHDLLARSVERQLLNPRYLPSTTGNFLGPIIRRYPYNALSYIFDREKAAEYKNSVVDLIANESPTGEDGQQAAVVPDEALLQWCSEDPQERCLFAARIFNVAEPSAAPSILHELFRLAPDKAAFIEAVADRFVAGGGTSDHEIPFMELGMRLISDLPCHGQADTQLIPNQVIERLRHRISWWKGTMDEFGKERAEAFE